MAQDAGTWRLSLDTAISHGLSGGHAEEHGLSESSELIDITAHRHEVELNLLRYELGLSRSIDDTWDVVLRLPYLVKEQTASVGFPDGGSAADRAAAARNGAIHHRTETYRGIGDPELMVGWRERDLFGDGSVFRFGFGLTVPLGETEEDPWVLGDAGQEHLHVQFGNGTFDPIADVYLGAPLGEHLGWSVYGKGRLPLYDNDHGYRGSPEALISPRLSYLITPKISLSAGAVGQYYGYSEWDSGRDRNSGQFSTYASLGIGYKMNEQLTASFTALLPFYTKTLSTEDSLDPAPTFSLSLGLSF